MTTNRKRWIDIDSPSEWPTYIGRVTAAAIQGTEPPPPPPKRPPWHYVLDNILGFLEVAWLVCSPWIAGAAVGLSVYWILTR